MFNSDFFTGNRIKLASRLPGELILVSANSLLQSTADQSFPFRQDSNFWYLTGVDEPDMVLAIDTAKGKSTIYGIEQSDYHKQWDGEVNSKEILAKSGAEQYELLSELPRLLKKAKEKGQQISFVQPLDERVALYGFYSNPARRKLLETIQKVEPKPKDIRSEITRLRQQKQPCELEQMQEAIDITGKALVYAKNKLESYKTEADLTRDITAGFIKNGADGHGYEPIVAGGKNAATIHYTKNDAVLNSGELILLDVGATVGYYSADISRTWKNGALSNRQKSIYDAVIDLQNQAFSILKEGVVVREYQKNMEERAAKAMKKLGVAHDKYPHGFSHFIGLDVHDVGDYDSPLKENSLLTVEPGIYLPDESIGVRVEDIVRITKSGVEVLSDKIPKSL